MLARSVGKTVGRAARFILAVVALRQQARPYVPLVCALVAGLVWLAVLGETEATGWLVASIAALLLLAPLIAICAIDAQFGIIPDGLVVLLVFGGCLVLAASDADAVQRIIEAAAVFGGGWLFRAAYFRLRGAHGLGLGDVKLAAAGVLWTGFALVPAVILISVVSALASLGVLRAQGHRMTSRDAIAFGPHLALGIWLAWVASFGRCCNGIGPW